MSKYIHPMRKGTTAKELAKRLSVNINTVYKYTAMPREIYEANSYSRTKPWEHFGISRATWYRHGKPMPTETTIHKERDKYCTKT